MDIPSIVSKAFEGRFKQRQRFSGKPNNNKQNGNSSEDKSDSTETVHRFEIDTAELQALNAAIEPLNLTIIVETGQSEIAQLQEVSSGRLIKTISAEYVVHLCNRLQTDGAEYFQASGFLLSEVV